MPSSRGSTQESNLSLLRWRQILGQLRYKGSPYTYISLRTPETSSLFFLVFSFNFGWSLADPRGCVSAAP